MGYLPIVRYAACHEATYPINQHFIVLVYIFGIHITI